MKRVLLLALLGLCLMAPVTGGGPGGTPQTDCDDAVNSKVLYDTATGLWSCGVDQGGGATWGFGTITTGASSAVADVGGDTLNVNDSNSINFTASNGPPDSLTAEAICTSPISCPAGSAITTSMNTDRLLGRTTAGSGVVEEINYDPLYIVLSGGVLAINDGDIVLWSLQDGDLNGFLDFADFATATVCIDANADASCELASNAPGTAGATLLSDVNQDGTNEINVNTSSFLSLNQIRAGSGIGVGDPTQATATNRYTVGNSACIGRDTTASVDRLFEDKDCDFGTTNTPEAGEGMVTDIIAKLTADHTLASTTGTQVTGLKLDLDGLTAYEVFYDILSQSSDTTVGLAYGITFTGTATFQCQRRYMANAAQTIANGTAGPATPVTEEIWMTSTASTTAPNLGPNTGGVQTANTTALEFVRCHVVVTAAGDLQFWHASETATNTSVMTNSTARAVRIN